MAIESAGTLPRRLLHRRAIDIAVIRGGGRGISTHTKQSLQAEQVSASALWGHRPPTGQRLPPTGAEPAAVADATASFFLSFFLSFSAFFSAFFSLLLPEPRRKKLYGLSPARKSRPWGVSLAPCCQRDPFGRLIYGIVHRMGCIYPRAPCSRTLFSFFSFFSFSFGMSMRSRAGRPHQVTETRHGGHFSPITRLNTTSRQAERARV